MQFRNMKIGARLGLGFGLVVLISFIVGLVGITQMMKLAENATELYDHPLTVGYAMRDIKADIFAMHRSMKDIALTRDVEQVDFFRRIVDEYEDDALAKFNIVLERFLGDISDVESARQALMDWRNIRQEVIALSKQGRWEEAAAVNKSKSADHVKHLEKKISVMTDYASKKATEFISHSQSSRDSAQLAMFTFLLLAVAASAALAIIITKSITSLLQTMSDGIEAVSNGILDKPIEIYAKDEIGLVADLLRKMQVNLQEKAAVAECIARGDLRRKVKAKGPEDSVALSINQIIDNFSEVVSQSKAIAVGDFSAEVAPRSDTDDLGKAVGNMLQSLKAVVEKAKQIARGDYSGYLEPKSSNDELALALNQMTSALRDVTEKNKLQSWIKTGQTELNEKMRGDIDEQLLAKNVLTYLSKYLDAQIGAVYLLDDDSNVLTLAASYAYTKRKNLSDRFKLGEGLVGQAALEQEIISVANLPDDYVRITSGIGDCLPRTMTDVPLVHDGKLLGVLELGSIQEFSETKTELLRSVAENIAIALNSAKARDRVANLLEQTQAQALSLQTQQEELRQTNEELEAQTQALLHSKSQLQTQQEELRVSNEELEERSLALEAQRDAVRKNNVELEQIRQDLAKKALDLENASKYKSEFLANMSHELRTPLNSILLLSRLLSENKGENLTEKQIEYARTVNSSGKDLLELIDEILDLSKIESGKMEVHLEKVNLKALAEDVERQFKEIARQKNIAFIVEVDPALPAVITTDSHRLDQILRNLLSNAFKFTSHGSVTVKMSRPNANSDLTRSGLAHEQAVAIGVLDTGIGVKKDKQAAIFEAFQQADGATTRKFGGTGLGLSISRELAKLLGGELQIESEEGKGSLLTIFLPECLKSKTKAAPPSSEAPRFFDSSKTFKKAAVISPQTPPTAVFIDDDRNQLQKGEKVILIVEDDKNFATTLCDLARERGFKCLATNTGETGLHLANYYNPSAIILDIGLPRMDGWEVMERLKANPDTRHIPVHFISAYDNSLNALRMGAIGYLTKPVDPEQLDSAFKDIENVLAKDVKKLLIVEDNEAERQGILGLIGDGDVTSTAVSSAEEAYGLLKAEQFDCMILDLRLKGLSGFELLEKIRKDEGIGKIPVIVYTGKDLTEEEEQNLRQYAESIIIKGARSPERLLAETTLFMHRVEANLPEERRKMLKMVHDKEAVLKDKKILIVDDDMRNIFAITSVLEDKGATAAAARNGREGLKKLEENPNVDLVIMDIMMPEMDGFEAIQKIRKQPKYAKLPIIALTAKAMKEDRAKCIESGASDYLAKPVEMQKLLSLLRVWLYK